jgi:GxxExxY protein
MQILLHRDITDRILAVFHQVHYELGAGFLESVYKTAMAIALMQAGLQVEREVPLAVYFRGLRIGSFRADLLVNSLVILEVKAVRQPVAAADAQLLNYLRCSDLEVGLLLNFGQRASFKRMLYTNDRKILPTAIRTTPFK